MVKLYVIHDDSTGKNYVGITNDLDRRLKEHRKGSGYTKRFGSVRLIYSEDYSDYVGAREREKFLKSGKGREFLKNIL